MNQTISKAELRNMQQAEALQRARSCRSLYNMALVLNAAEERGITDAEPGVNVLTFNAWKAAGRVVRKGEKALCKLPTWIDRKDQDDAGNEVSGGRMFRTAAVFHISQTEPLERK